jgi:hypothetical protein
MTHILHVTWDDDFALVDKREKNEIQKKLDEFDALISKLQVDDNEMSIKIYIHMIGEITIFVNLRLSLVSN